MHLKKTVTCESCGAAATLEIKPGADAASLGFILTRTCSGNCAGTHSSLTPEEATELTGHAWDGTSTAWTRLASTSVEGWVP
jgi:hypothetical protein